MYLIKSEIDPDITFFETMAQLISKKMGYNNIENGGNKFVQTKEAD